MTREKLLHVPVENKSDDVLCPECNEKMRKEDPPNIPMPDPPESGEWLAAALGQAFCENADCPVSKEPKSVSWSYRTSVATHWEIVNPAKEGEPFHGTLDKEPDGGSESKQWLIMAIRDWPDKGSDQPVRFPISLNVEGDITEEDIKAALKSAVKLLRLNYGKGGAEPV